MSLEKEEPIYQFDNSSRLIELRLWFKDNDGDKVRFDIDPQGELWVQVDRTLVLLRRDDVEILLTKMRDTFAARVDT